MSWWKRSNTPESVDEINGDIFYGMGGGSPDIWGTNKFMQDFLEVPEVNAILNARARALSSMKIEAIDKETKEIWEGDDPLVDVLRIPNYFQSQVEFLKQESLFRDINGNEYWYFLSPMFDEENVKAMFALPSQNVKVKYNGNFNRNHDLFFETTEFPKEIQYSFETTNGLSKPLNKEDILCFNDNRVEFKKPEDYFTGVSKGVALTPAIENIRAAYEARNVLITQRGAIGILSNSSKDGIGSVAPMDGKEKKRLQAQFKQYGLTKKQWQVIITSLSLNWQQMAIDVDKLRLFEETREDTTKICDSFGYNYELLGTQKGVTFKNKRQSEKQFYQNTIIPESQERINAINQRFDTKNKDYLIVGSFDHLAIFDDDRKDRAESIKITVSALSQALSDKAITIEEYMKELKRYGIINN